MNEQTASAGEALLVDLQAAAPGLVRPLDFEHSTRFEAALEAPGTRRAYGSALAAWGRRAALLGVHTISPQPFTLRA